MSEPAFDFEQWVVDQLSGIGCTVSTWFPGHVVTHCEHTHPEAQP